MIRTVISDLGKVIVHFDNSIFFAKLSAATGLAVEDITGLAFSGTGLINAFDAGALDPDAFRSEVCRRLGISVGHEAFFKTYNDIFRLIPGTLDVLGRAKRTCRLVLLSNTDPMRYGHIVRTYPQTQIFDSYVLSFKERLIKPDPRIYELALDRAEADAPECVFIDDRPENVAAATALGIRGVVFEEGRTDLGAELGRAGIEL
jgi:FMN phosphatase YigB (HAD superfamily)